MVRFADREATVFVASFAGWVPFLALAHRAFCARAIFLREASEMIRLG
jgi:hypothetical protein